jgi:hypothetical protein
MSATELTGSIPRRNNMSIPEKISNLMVEAASKVASLSKDETQRRIEVLAATSVRSGRAEADALDLCVHTFQVMRKIKAVMVGVLPEQVSKRLLDDMFDVVSHTCAVCLELVHPGNHKAAIEMSALLRTLLASENQMFEDLERAVEPVSQAIIKHMEDGGEL